MSRIKNQDNSQKLILLASCAVFLLGAIMMLVYAFGNGSNALFWVGIIAGLIAAGGLVYSNMIYRSVLKKKAAQAKREATLAEQQQA